VTLQVLAERPADPVDVLETALLVKKESTAAGSSGSLVEPVPVSVLHTSAPAACICCKHREVTAD
jgi:hypothetical protein